MTFPHCETCRHWGNQYDRDGEYRTCTAVIHDPKGFADDDSSYREDPDIYDPEEIEEYRAFRSTHKAVVQDGSGYSAALKPRRDFGCVLHEAKTTGAPQ
jgi:hypothetical protein